MEVLPFFFPGSIAARSASRSVSSEEQSKYTTRAVAAAVFKNKTYPIFSGVNIVFITFFLPPSAVYEVQLSACGFDIF